jgi:hypothetical protein
MLTPYLKFRYPKLSLPNSEYKNYEEEEQSRVFITVVNQSPIPLCYLRDSPTDFLGPPLVRRASASLAPLAGPSGRQQLQVAPVLAIRQR